MSAFLYCILLSLFLLFPFSTHCLFLSVCCFSHNFPHQCISPMLHFPTCCIRVTPLHTNRQVANFQSANVCSYDQPQKSVQVSGVHCHVCASSTRGCAFGYSTVWNCIEYSRTVPFIQALDVWKQA